jgi:hypothetical protein
MQVQRLLNYTQTDAAVSPLNSYAARYTQRWKALTPAEANKPVVYQAPLFLTTCVQLKTHEYQQKVQCITL